MEIIRAQLEHLDALAPLFDAYRVFYQQPSDLLGATAFLKERLDKKDSVIFLAHDEGVGAGFTQLYPSFSSVTMEPLYILNDLFVMPKLRGQGLGGQLLLHAQGYAVETGRKGLELATAKDNPAQRLYERLGWRQDDFHHYFWKAKG